MLRIEIDTADNETYKLDRKINDFDRALTECRKWREECTIRHQDIKTKADERMKEHTQILEKLIIYLPLLYLYTDLC